jgi:hypothetical protein
MNKLPDLNRVIIFSNPLRSQTVGETSVSDLIKDEIELDDEDQIELEAEDQNEVEGDEEQSEDGDEIEIVLAGDVGSQPEVQNNLGIRKRVNKLNAKVNAAEGVADEANSALETERQKNKLLQLALDQRNQTPEQPSGPPDPFDYDDGGKDDKYIDALKAYNQRSFDDHMARHSSAQPDPEIRRDLEDRQTAHYEAADKLGIPDYAESEDRAISILGRDTVNQIIGALDNSPEILDHLGKNIAKANRIAGLLKTDPVKGVLELGQLSKSDALTAQPKLQRKAAPDPDTELQGSSVARNTNGTRGPEGATFT